jgi:hypothetical protein
MNDSAISLDRLHDLALPPGVPWWPPAPGWYAVFATALLAVGLWAWRAWKRWRADAYRRAALRELASSQDAATIAELLRRTALARTPRPVVAALAGTAWVDWLETRGTGTMPPEVRRVLDTGIYSGATMEAEVGALRDYAARWIAGHRLDIPAVTATG